MKTIVEFKWDEEFGIAECIIRSKDNSFYATGYACCHPDDIDMKSEKTGCEIAHKRAVINASRKIRDNELKPQIATLKHLYSCMSDLKDFDPKSRMAKMTKNMIDDKELELQFLKDIIENQREDLRNYINKKDDFYKAVRAYREINIEHNPK